MSAIMQNVGNYAEYNRIVVITIDIDVLILLISFISDEIDLKLEILSMEESTTT